MLAFVAARYYRKSMARGAFAYAAKRASSLARARRRVGKVTGVELLRGARKSASVPSARKRSPQTAEDRSTAVMPVAARGLFSKTKARVLAPAPIVPSRSSGALVAVRSTNSARASAAMLPVGNLTLVRHLAELRTGDARAGRTRSARRNSAGSRRELFPLKSSSGTVGVAACAPGWSMPH